MAEVGKTCRRCGTFFLGNKCPKCGSEVLSVAPKPLHGKEKQKTEGVYN